MSRGLSGKEPERGVVAARVMRWAARAALGIVVVLVVSSAAPVDASGGGDVDPTELVPGWLAVVAGVVLVVVLGWLLWRAARYVMGRCRSTDVSWL
jgi:protein-S-isoprenylcysteine O-methyltransferase Ste14